MISIDYTLVVPTFSPKEIGYTTMVRSHESKFKVDVTNDGLELIGGLSIRPVMESYVGQEKAHLFQWSDTQVIKEIPPKGMVSLEFKFYPIFPGLVSVALYVTDTANSAVLAKRMTDSSYEKTPVRWWFHVADNISIETLRVLKKLAAAGGKKK
jgi:hypothetical protein